MLFVDDREPRPRQLTSSSKARGCRSQTSPRRSRSPPSRSAPWPAGRPSTTRPCRQSFEPARACECARQDFRGAIQRPGDRLIACSAASAATIVLRSIACANAASGRPLQVVADLAPPRSARVNRRGCAPARRRSARACRQHRRVPRGARPRCLREAAGRWALALQAGSTRDAARLSARCADGGRRGEGASGTAPRRRISTVGAAARAAPAASRRSARDRP